MAVVIQQPDPNAGINSLASGFSEGRDKAQALALAREKQAADERNQTRALDLQQMRTESDIAAQKSQTAIAEAQEAYRKKVEPILYAQAQATLDGTITANKKAQAEATVAQIDADFKAQLHALGLDMQQAELTIKQTQSQITANVAAQHQAEAATKRTQQLLPGEIAQQGATLAETRAQTALTNRTPGGGIYGQATLAKQKATQAESDAEFQLMKARVDDAYKGGKSPDELRQQVYSAPAGTMSNVTAMKLLGYINTLKPQAPQAAAPGGGILQGIGNALTNAWHL